MFCRSDVAEVELHLDGRQADGWRCLLFLFFDERDQSCQFFLTPKHPLYERKEPPERSFPISDPCCQAQQQISKQSDPDLPFDGVFAGSEEIGQQEGLLDSLEKNASPRLARERLQQDRLFLWDICGQNRIKIRSKAEYALENPVMRR